MRRRARARSSSSRTPTRRPTASTASSRSSDTRAFFADIAGVVLGDFAGAGAPKGTEATDLEWVLHDRLGRLKVPVAYGFPFGHRPRSWTLPFGVRARLDAPDRAKTPTLTIVEPAVRAAK